MHQLKDINHEQVVFQEILIPSMRHLSFSDEAITEIQNLFDKDDLEGAFELIAFNFKKISDDRFTFDKFTLKYEMKSVPRTFEYYHLYEQRNACWFFREVIHFYLLRTKTILILESYKLGTACLARAELYKEALVMTGTMAQIKQQAAQDISKYT